MEHHAGGCSVMLDPTAFLLCISQPSMMPIKLFRRMLLSSIWQRYQRGHFGLHEAAQQLAQLPFLSTSHWTPHDIALLLQDRPVTPVPCMLQLLDVLCERLHLRLFCVCNASAEELHALRSQFPDLFARFSMVFASAEEGVGKPSLRFLQIAMKKAGISAHRTVYLDAAHDLESVVAARSLGMHALLVEPLPMTNTESLGPLHYALIRDILLAFSPTGLQNRSWSPALPHLPPLLAEYPLHYDSNPSISTKADAACQPPCSEASLQTTVTPSFSLPASACWISTALASARHFLLRIGAAVTLLGWG